MKLPFPQLLAGTIPKNHKHSVARPKWEETERELSMIRMESNGEIKSLIHPLEIKDRDYAREVAQLKRLTERWYADETFREQFDANPLSTVANLGLEIDMAAILDYLTRMERAEGPEEVAEAKATAPLSVRRHKHFIREKLLFREKTRATDCCPPNPQHKAWRERQIRRTRIQLGAVVHDGIVHVPFTVELSDGCSVGCWFCGVTAKKREGDYLYNDGNAAEWQEICGVLREMFEDSASSGFLYWASEPLDNPDYEKFAVDFAKICGRFPQTTTSIAHKDVERTRNLLKLSNQHGCRINRFSILSLNQFNKVMEAFSPEELLHCEIVAQNNESFFVQGSAGRARGNQKLKDRMKKKTGAEEITESPGTIACVSGFLINMVRRTVRLITPCPASDKWPNGYWVIDQGTFSNAQDFKELLQSLIERNLHGDLRYDSPVRLLKDARVESTLDTITIHTPLCVTTFRGYPLAELLAKSIAEGTMTAGQIAVRIEDETGEPAAEIFAQLNNIFASGVLDEEPLDNTDLG